MLYASAPAGPSDSGTGTVEDGGSLAKSAYLAEREEEMLDSSFSNSVVTRFWRVRSEVEERVVLDSGVLERDWSSWGESRMGVELYSNGN